MPRHTLELAVEPGGEAVRLAITEEEQTVFAALLEAPELDELIRALAQGRAQLSDQIAPELDEGARISDVVAHPTFLVGKNDADGEVLLTLRHPGYGWLGFRLGREVIGRVVRSLDDWLRRTA